MNIGHSDSAVSDAVAFGLPENDVLRNVILNDEICQNVTRRLVKDDIWKFKILLHELFPRQEIVEMNSFEELICKIRTHREPGQLMAELLYRIKRYDLLKCLGTCKHKLTPYICKSTSRILNYYWVGVYNGLESADLTQANAKIEELLKREGNSLNLGTRRWFEPQGQNSAPIASSLATKNTENGLHDSESCNYQLNYGYCIIINNETFLELQTRDGTNVDRDKLKRIFENLCFDVHIHNNLSAAKISDLFHCVRKENFTRYDAFVCCILSHGLQGVIYGTDSKTVKIQREILDHFSQEQCPTLKGKPKLFFIQACQGRKHLQSDSASLFHPPNDTLIFMSTIEGFRSWRHQSKGSWFIDCLTEALESLGHEMNLHDIITRVCEKVSQRKANTVDEEGNPLKNVRQMPIWKSALRKKLIFQKKS